MLTFSTRSLAEENEETQAFGNSLAQGFVPTAKVGEYAFLETQHGLSDDDENGDADIEEDDRAQDVFGRVDAPELRVRSFREAQELTVQQSRARRALDENEDVDMLGREEEEDETYDERVRRELSPQIHLGASSSPAAPLKLNLKHRTTTTVVQAAHVDDFADLDVRFPFLSTTPALRCASTDASPRSCSRSSRSLASSTAPRSSTASATSRASRPTTSAAGAAQCASSPASAPLSLRVPRPDSTFVQHELQAHDRHDDHHDCGGGGGRETGREGR